MTFFSKDLSTHVNSLYFYSSLLFPLPLSAQVPLFFFPFICQTLDRAEIKIKRPRRRRRRKRRRYFLSFSSQLHTLTTVILLLPLHSTTDIFSFPAILTSLLASCRLILAPLCHYQPADWLACVLDMCVREFFLCARRMY